MKIRLVLQKPILKNGISRLITCAGHGARQSLGPMRPGRLSVPNVQSAVYCRQHRPGVSATVSQSTQHDVGAS